MRVISARRKPLRELAPRVPQVLTELVDRLLEKEPDCRPASAREVVAAFDQIIATPSHELSPTVEVLPGVQTAVLHSVAAGEPDSLQANGRWLGS